MEGKIGEFIGIGVALGFGLTFLYNLALNLTGNAAVGVNTVINAITSNLGLLGLAFLAIIFAFAWRAYKGAGIGSK